MSPSLARENREFAAELKFLVPSSVGAQIRDWSRANLAADPYGSGVHQDEYHIHSIYFDTEDFDVFHRRGSYGRSKFRIRRYGENEMIFLERKLRTNGMLTKRRSTVTLGDLTRLAPTESNGSWDGSWYHRRLLLRRLRPVVQIGYHRTARVLMWSTGPVRLTLDEKVRATPVDGIQFRPEESTTLLHGQTILELKYRLEVPPVFKLLIEEFALSPTRMSKYRLAARELGLVTPDALQEAQA